MVQVQSSRVGNCGKKRRKKKMLALLILRQWLLLRDSGVSARAGPRSAFSISVAPESINAYVDWDPETERRTVRKGLVTSWNKC